MEIIQASTDFLVLRISREQLLIVNAALNEVCNGIDVFEFETRIGADRLTVAKLLNEVGNALDGDRPVDL